MHFTRRNFLKASAGTLAVSSLAPRGVRAQAAAEKPAVVLIFFEGGYNAIWSAADAYVPGNFYGCTASNTRDLGNGLVVDAGALGSLPDALLGKMCTVGINHGASGHDFAREFAWYDGRHSMPLMMADALGGTSPFRCVHFGEAPNRNTPHPPYNGVVMTGVPDLTAALTLFTETAPAAGTPKKELMARALRGSLAMSSRTFERNPTMLQKTWDGTHTLLNALERPPPPGIDWIELSTAYGIDPTDTSAVSFTSQMAGAELMVRAGSDVVCVTTHKVDGENWDTHGDGIGEQSRIMMAQLLPTIRIFLERTLALSGRNVVTAMFGDFARIGGREGQDSGHAGGTSATVFGKYVKPGTTGRFSVGQNPNNAAYKLPPETPDHRGFRAFLTAAARANGQPWGPNPHTALLLS